MGYIFYPMYRDSPLLLNKLDKSTFLKKVKIFIITNWCSHFTGGKIKAQWHHQTTQQGLLPNTEPGENWSI